MVPLASTLGTVALGVQPAGSMESLAADGLWTVPCSPLRDNLVGTPVAKLYEKRVSFGSIESVSTFMLEEDSEEKSEWQSPRSQHGLPVEPDSIQGPEEDDSDTGSICGYDPTIECKLDYDELIARVHSFEVGAAKEREDIVEPRVEHSLQDEQVASVEDEREVAPVRRFTHCRTHSKGRHL
mmetsp:Transcript_127615/g.355172  ORF Transcript_127615/g.355172 Transcript_127615/m.355172 type:complete len:182 (-) Transcript_127615:35-580(-)